jgi:hypothetical protein
MRRSFAVVLGLVVAAGLAAALVLVARSRYGVQVGDRVVTWSGDRYELDRRMRGFLEAIQFKDFDKAANYHDEKDRDKRNISQLIESKFFIKPEELDIRAYQIREIDLTESGDRARILTLTTVHKLNTTEVRDVEAMFYWAKENGVWYLKLESSL